MTLQMILALGVLIFMIVLIMADVLPFGAPPLLASLLLVVFQLYPADADPIAYAFAGFTDSNVWMIAFFMVVLAAFQKTSFTARVRSQMFRLAERGGFKGYLLLVLLVMVACALTGGHSTGFYVLILGLVATIPYDKKLPTSKLVMPLGFACFHPVIFAVNFGLCVGILNSAGFATDGVSMTPFIITTLIGCVGYFIWSFVGYRLLPDHAIAVQQERSEEVAASDLPQWKELVTVACLVASVVGMMFAKQLGDVAYILPGIFAFLLLGIKVVDWQEMRNSLFSPVVLMMCCVIPVANALSDSGFTALVGNMVADAASSMPPFWLTFVFCLLTSACATFTGANFASAYIFVPIVIAACLALGVNPVGPAAASTMAAFAGGFLPIDGLPALVYGWGNYSMKEFWKFTIPMWIINCLFLAIGAMVAF